MKVLYIVKTNIGATWAFNQAKCLKEYGIEISVVLPKGEEGLGKSYKEYGMKVIKSDFSLPTSRLWILKKRIKEIREIVNIENPDIIHCHFFTNIFLVRLALNGFSNIPRIFQVPGPLHLESFFFRYLDVCTAKNNDYWIATCEKSLEIYKNSKVASEKLFLGYYGGAGGKSISEYKKSKNKLHEEYNISSNKILVGMVSYFYKPKYFLLQNRGLKGHEDFIEAISIARKKNANIVGVINGGPWGNSQKYMNKIKKKAKKICGNNIIFTGFRNDLKEIYKELNIVIHPSLSENLGGAAESLAAGVPTITTNIGGFTDIIKDGETGLLVNTKSPNEIANAILSILENSKKTSHMVLKGQLLVKDLLDINNTSQKVLSIYIKILNINS